ncbi:MAG: Tripartite tricarboxylate transporter family receptor [Betaproteobacteria bacterium]|nr:Tripartite tricarboxylate transporter family receptor [Betaproteobacteria bacterium]
MKSFSLARHACLAIAVLAAAAQPALAQDRYPDHPVKFIVPYVPGGSNDIIARLVGQNLGETLKTSMVIENHGGAGGNIGLDIAAKSAPDGYTIVIGHVGTFSINPALYSKLPYNPQTDFAPIGMIAMIPNVLVVNKDLPVKNTQELIALAKKEPGKLSYGSGGNGSAAHLAVEHFKNMAGVNIVHVPYKGTSPSLTDLMGGQVQMTITGLLPVKPYMESGRLRVLATASPKRLKLLPNLPTIAESGVPGYEATQWYGLFTQAKVPAPVIAKLSEALRAAMKSPAVADRLAAEGGEPLDMTQEETRKFLDQQAKLWAGIVKVSGAKVD